MGLWLGVKVRRGLNTSTNRAYEVSASESFQDLLQKLPDISENDVVANVRIYNQSEKFEMIVKLDTPVGVCNQFSAFLVEFVMDVQAPINSGEQTSERDATVVLMENVRNRRVPDKVNATNNFERLSNRFIDYLETNQINWHPTVVDSTGKQFVESMTNLLWHITSQHDTFTARAAALPQFVTEIFANWNDYISKKKSKPRLSDESLTKYIEEISVFLSQPWMSRNKLFRKDVDALVEACKKVSDYLKQANAQTKAGHRKSTVSEKYPEIVFVEKSDNIPFNYQKVNTELDSLEPYTPLHLSDFEPESRYERRHWVDSLVFRHDVAVMKKSYGGRVPNINIVWKVVHDTAHETNMGKVTIKVNNELPSYHSRQLRRDFIEKVQKVSRMNVGVINEIYQNLTGDSSAPSNANEKARRKRIVEGLASLDEEELIADLRYLNGDPGSTKFDDFWQEVDSQFIEYEASVHERRTTDVLYLPFAISTRDLIEKVLLQKPGIKAPSEEWVRLQFEAKNPNSLSAMSHTGRFKIKYQVQRRLMRANHDDAKYVYHQQRFAKEFAVKYKDQCTFVSADDKAVVPVGEPEHAISSGARAHNPSLGPSSSGAVIGALDHDWKIAGIIPSVSLHVDIPDQSTQSFFTGKPHVVLKDRIFQQSSPFRHGAELTKQIGENSTPILILITDGGGDHNTTHSSVQASLIADFVKLDLDFLFAMRTCPTQSWTNLAERVMSLLNIALQNVALERESMSKENEDIVRKNNNMAKLRKATSDNSDFHVDFETSMKDVISLVGGRFERMKLKEEAVECHDACTDEEVQIFFENLHQIDETIDRSKLSAADLSKHDKYKQFVKEHCCITTYTYQIKKCKAPTCNYCATRTPRLPSDVFETLNFLPAPLLDSSKEHYEKFDKLYGSVPNEKDMPSLKFSLDLIEEDKLHKDMLVAQKARLIIKCALCRKPRCIFANKKLSKDVKLFVESLISDEEYACGGSLTEDESYLRHSVVVRRQLTCASSIETAYFSSNLDLPTVCCHCGGSSGAKLIDDDEESVTLKRKFSVVRSVCELCKSAGLKPMTRAPRFDTEKGSKKKKK